MPYSRLKPSAALILVGLLAAGSAARGDRAYPVLEIEDGDTLILEIAGQVERVQLLGIDAPEDTDNAKFKLDLRRTGLEADMLMALGQAATAHLEALLRAQSRVRLEADLEQRDKYGRIPAQVFDARERSLGEAMVEDGYAIVLGTAAAPAAYLERLEKLERLAREQGEGLWGDHGEAAGAWYEQNR